jgi:multidrug efflux pump subunit AcrB
MSDNALWNGARFYFSGLRIMSLYGSEILAVLLTQLVVASRFESFRHPFVIMFTIPLALFAVVGGLTATTFLTLFIMPVIYSLFEKASFGRKD